MVYNYYYSAVIEQSCKASQINNHWIKKNQAIYTRGILGTLKLKSSYSPSSKCITKFNTHSKDSTLFWNDNFPRYLSPDRQIQLICGYFVTWKEKEARGEHTVNSNITNEVSTDSRDRLVPANIVIHADSNNVIIL